MLVFGVEIRAHAAGGLCFGVRIGWLFQQLQPFFVRLGVQMGGQVGFGLKVTGAGDARILSSSRQVLVKLDLRRQRFG